MFSFFVHRKNNNLLGYESRRFCPIVSVRAHVAEQADALGLGPSVRKDVGVQLPPWAPNILARVAEQAELFILICWRYAFGK